MIVVVGGKMVVDYVRVEFFGQRDVLARYGLHVGRGLVDPRHGPLWCGERAVHVRAAGGA